MDAYDSVWIVGDDFVSDTATEFFNLEDSGNSHISQNYDVKILCSDSKASNQSVIASIHNNITTGIIDQPLLPKAIIFLIDADILKTVYHPKMGVSEIYNKMMKDLVAGLQNMLGKYKSCLPMKSKHENYPTLLWALAPLHKNLPDKWNQQRTKFNQSIEAAVKECNHMSTLNLLKIWDAEDDRLCEESRLTQQGLTAYWRSLDSAFRHWDTFVYAKKNKDRGRSYKSTKGASSPRRRSSNEFIRKENVKFKWFNDDKYHWNSEDRRRASLNDNSDRRKLPHPPY